MPACRFYKYTRPAISTCPVVPCTQTETPDRPYSELVAVPESVRLERMRCREYTVSTGESTNPCISNPGTRIQTTSSAPVSNLTVSGSEYVAQLRSQTVYAATNPANPVTRFEQYFRPLPPQPADLVMGPERLPNKDPITPDRPCVGFSRYQGSTPGVN